MTLTVVVGASGSGKTTFLNDVAKRHKCTYVRQYHGIRPYIPICKIPCFDPTELPYWDTYVREKTADTILAGGTMAGEFTAGLSGGQRKMLLFELIHQRVKDQSNLLLVLDEPFAGVTDDFVPFIVGRLNQMRKKHNILLVTNDHVATLTELADNTIRVSAVNRTIVEINDNATTNREKVILALSVGEQYEHQATTWDDLRFFATVEIVTNGSLKAVAVFTIVAFCLFATTFWNSNEMFGAFVIVAASIISFFCLHPYLLALVDWRNYMTEEAEALLHSSKATNKILKTALSLVLILIVSLVEWGTVNLIINGFEDRKFWIAMLMDNASLTFPFIFFGLFTKLSETRVQIGASLPFLLMVFLSGTFSPSAGVPGLKALRFLFVRFYFWCMIPSVQGMMEDCPSDDVIILYVVLAALFGSVMFLTFCAIRVVVRFGTNQQTTSKQQELMDTEFFNLQLELYGKPVVRHPPMKKKGVVSLYNEVEAQYIGNLNASTCSDDSPPPRYNQRSNWEEEGNNNSSSANSPVSYA